MSSLSVTTLKNLDGSKSVPVNTVVDGSAKVWATIAVAGGTPTVSASFNVSSITDAGVGSYELSLTSPIANMFNRTALASGGGRTGVSYNDICDADFIGVGTLSVRVCSSTAPASLVDPDSGDFVHVIGFAL